MPHEVRVWSIGHSTHSLEAFVELLKSQGIENLVDIRTVPKSRRNPQFHTDALAVSMPERDVSYRHLPDLGGWRKTDKDSPNGGWRNDSFRGYADYTMTAGFRTGLKELLALAGDGPTAMMCSEALWWRCHRRLVSDRLLTAGHSLFHIGSDGRITPHELTSFAVIDSAGQITYPPEDD
ncbi:MAG: DUF488 domain-containing protein [Thermoleophilia bacterium]|nr:DUF488 domain-containing protein [Thermoleophilia bacterium]